MKTPFFPFVLIALWLIPCSGYCQQAVTHLKSPNWSPMVKSEINAFFDAWAFEKQNGQKPYAVFDFDNTTAILDVEEHVVIYQLEQLRMGIKPEQMYNTLVSGVPQSDLLKPLEGLQKSASIDALARDAAQAYKKLYEAGCIQIPNRTPRRADWGVHSADAAEFAVKVWLLYETIDEQCGSGVSYPWITYLFTGMTPQEVFDLTQDALDYYKQQSSLPGYFTVRTISSPANYPSRCGAVSIRFKQGLVVSDELKELYAALDANGIDVYVCTASLREVIRAAAAFFALPGIDGFIGLEIQKDARGRYVNQYDYSVHPITQGKGKTDAIKQILAPRYGGNGPIFTAGDSLGDYDFCTAFPETRICLILNRVRSDDFGLLAAQAVWQTQSKIYFSELNKAGKTRYLLQGRNENRGVLHADSRVILLGESAPKLLSQRAEEYLRTFNAEKK